MRAHGTERGQVLDPADRVNVIYGTSAADDVVADAAAFRGGICYGWARVACVRERETDLMRPLCAFRDTRSRRPQPCSPSAGPIAAAPGAGPLALGCASRLLALGELAVACGPGPAQLTSPGAAAANGCHWRAPLVSRQGGRRCGDARRTGWQNQSAPRFLAHHLHRPAWAHANARRLGGLGRHRVRRRGRTRSPACLLRRQVSFSASTQNTPC